jgi:hypothetical protein
MHGRRAVAIRTTGDAGKSGGFQTYLPLKTGGLASTGDPFHVRYAHKNQRRRT